MHRNTAYVLWLFFGPPALFVLWWLMDPTPKPAGLLTVALFALYLLPVAGHELARER